MRAEIRGGPKVPDAGPPRAAGWAQEAARPALGAATEGVGRAALFSPQKTVYGANVIVFEGILAFANKELLKVSPREGSRRRSEGRRGQEGEGGGCRGGCSPLPVFQLLDMKVFVDTDSDIRLVRRLQRDIMERGRDIVGVIKQYHKFVKPAFEQYIEPSVQVADIVVPRGETRPLAPDPIPPRRLGAHPHPVFSALRAGGENSVALDLIVQHVHSQLEKVRGWQRGEEGAAHRSAPPGSRCRPFT